MTVPPNAFECVVIGAGLTGLTAAWTLQEAGVNVAIVEKESDVGGVIQSHWVEPKPGQRYLLESGPTTFQSTNEALKTLCEKIGLVPQRANAAANRRFLFSDGKLHPFPMGPLALLLSPLLSMTGKVLIAREPKQAPLQYQLDTEETVAAFFSRRFGQEVLSQFVTPFVSGVYAGDPEKLSINSVFPKLVEWEKTQGSVLRAVMNQPRKKKKEPYTLLNFANGMQALPNALCDKLQNCWTNTRLTSIEQDNTGQFMLYFNDRHPVKTQSILFATPTEVTADYLPFFAPEAAKALCKIHYAPIIVIQVAVPKRQIRHLLNGFGALIPRTQKVLLLGTIFANSLFRERAPKEMALLTCFYGGAQHPEVMKRSDDELKQQVIEDLTHVLNQGQGELTPEFIDIKRWSKAIPQYEVGHAKLVQTIQRSISEVRGLFVAGNYLGGVSLDDCVKQGTLAAESVKRFLSMRPRKSSISSTSR